MSTLLLRLASPLQSWGVDSKFNRRETQREPTKSGVLGLVAAALGRHRNEKMDDLCALRFGVRIDQEGTLLRDFHMVHEDAFWQRRATKYAHLTNRYYLADAQFLVGLEGDPAMLEQIDYALQNPIFPLFLGRRSCPPSGQLSLGIREGMGLFEALQEEPWLGSEYAGRWESTSLQLRIITDASEDFASPFLQQDEPISFDQQHRKFGFRKVRQHPFISVVNIHSQKIQAGVVTEHDPIGELE